MCDKCDRLLEDIRRRIATSENCYPRGHMPGIADYEKKLMLNRFGSYINLTRKYIIEWKLEALYGTTKECVPIKIESWLG